MPYPGDWSIILVVYLKNRKIGFPLEMDFCLRFRLTCRCDPDGVTPIVKCMHGHYGVIGQTSHKNTDFFLFWPGYSQKNAFLKGRKKRVYATLRFSRVYFNSCHPVDDTDRKREYWYICKLLEETEGQLPWLNQNLNYQNYRVRHIFRVQSYTGSLWLSSSF